MSTFFKDFTGFPTLMKNTPLDRENVFTSVRKNQGHSIKLIISLPQKFLNVPTVHLLIGSEYYDGCLPI